MDATFDIGIGLQEVILILFILGALVGGGILFGILFGMRYGRSKNSEANPNLVSCPDCGRLISRLATTCPQCGRPLSPPH